MKLSVTQENLSRAINAVARIANTRGTLAILANVLIRTNHNRLSISATNLNIAITYSLGAKISEEGSVTVPARLMQDFVSSLPSGVIDLKLDENKLRITTDRYKSVVNGIMADDFPVMPAISGGQKWSIKSGVFKQALNQVTFAASNDETRPVLTGVYLHSLNGKLFMAATDSYRLAEKELGNNSSEVDLLVPAYALAELSRLLEDADTDINITHDDQQALFQAGDFELVTRLIDSKYPDYHKLIPAKFTTSATIKRSEFTSIVKVSALFARESAGSVTIEVDSKTKLLSIQATASQLGENTATAEIEAKGGGKITLNSRYLLDALNALGGEEVVFGFNGKLEPTMLHDPANPDYRHIIMPLKS